MELGALFPGLQQILHRPTAPRRGARSAAV